MKYFEKKYFINALFTFTFETTKWITRYMVVCFVWPFHMGTPSVCGIYSKCIHDLVFSRTLSRNLVNVYSHTCLSLMLVVVGLFERCSMYLCIAYTLLLVLCRCWVVLKDWVKSRINKRREIRNFSFIHNMKWLLPSTNNNQRSVGLVRIIRNVMIIISGVSFLFGRFIVMFTCSKSNCKCNLCVSVCICVLCWSNGGRALSFKL